MTLGLAALVLASATSSKAPTNGLGMALPTKRFFLKVAVFDVIEDTF